MRRLLTGVAAGLVASVLLLHLAAWWRGPQHASTRLVAEDASAPISRIAIHYAPSADRVALDVWKQFFAVLPAKVDVQVEVGQKSDFDRFLRFVAPPHAERFHPVVVGTTITTWSRDRYAALVDDHHRGSILAPPKIESPSVARAGDARSPAAISRALYNVEPLVADIAFEGGDLAATPNVIFADINLAGRNLGRRDADRESIENEIHKRFGQELVWLGDAVGDVPRHHIMMYMVPLDDKTIAVGDIRKGVELLGDTPFAMEDVEEQAARFDRAAAMLEKRGFRVERIPALVRLGGGSFVTYTNAVFDRHENTRVVYLPVYRLPALDRAGRAFYEKLGYEVHPIDVSQIYGLNGSLGCLVNVLARD